MTWIALKKMIPQHFQNKFWIFNTQSMYVVLKATPNDAS